VSASLTDILVRNRAVDAWAQGGSQVPHIVTGSGGNLLIQVPNPTIKAKE